MRLNTIAYAQAPGPSLTVVSSHSTDPCDDRDHAAHNGARPEGARKIEQSITYMRQHLNEPLQIARLAQTAHTSPSHFFVLFKRWTGSSPIDYFIRLRMQEACRLLAATSSSVKEIAAALGYDDPFYFSRLFKSVHGVAPSDYRLTIEHPAQTNGPEGMPGSEKDGLWPILPIPEFFENNAESERSHHEKHSIIH